MSMEKEQTLEKEKERMNNRNIVDGLKNLLWKKESRKSVLPLSYLRQKCSSPLSISLLSCFSDSDSDGGDSGSDIDCDSEKLHILSVSKDDKKMENSPAWTSSNMNTPIDTDITVMNTHQQSQDSICENDYEFVQSPLTKENDSVSAWMEPWVVVDEEEGSQYTR